MNRTLLHRINTIQAEIESEFESQPLPSRCEQMPGMCCGDPGCPDKHCPGHPEARIAAEAIGYESALPIEYAEPEPELFSLVGELVKAWPWALIALVFALAAAVRFSH